MVLIKCENGHFYDGDKFPSCPQCAHIPVQQICETDQAEISTAIPNANFVNQVNQSLRKTVGWLLCTQGSMLGESFPIREGVNRIGRSTAMDIILLYENSVSREDHAVIRYDSKKRSYTLETENPECFIAVNHKKIKKTAKLSDRDEITIGKCTLTFVPFCNQDFDWNDMKNQESLM